MTRLILSPSEDKLYYTALNSSKKGVVCEFTITSQTSVWVDFGTLEDINIFIQVDTTKFFIISREDSIDRPVAFLLEWGNPTPVWANVRGWQTQTTCKVETGSAILSKDSSKIYNVLPQDRYVFISI